MEEKKERNIYGERGADARKKKKRDKEKTLGKKQEDSIWCYH
jgi:hypothetical protein